jgi:transcriptional regulator with XRE-family HTH domain
MKFGEMLKATRERTGHSQEALADAAAVSLGALRDYEQSRRLPGWPAVVRMARALGVSVDSFNGADEVAEAKQKGKAKK